MEQNILLSKVVSNSTDFSWAQALSTLHLYLVVSLHSETADKLITTIGKEFTERLQREFFALSEKKLDTIKEAVSNSLTVLPENTDYSITLATVIGEVLYMVIAGPGHVILRRNGAFHTVATGEPTQIKGFSGKLKHTDIVILETAGFAERISLEKIASIPHVVGVLDLSEDIAPLIHDGARGTEAAIFLQYQNSAQAQAFGSHSQSSPTQTPELGVPQISQIQYPETQMQPQAQHFQPPTQPNPRAFPSRLDKPDQQLPNYPEEEEYDDQPPQEQKKRRAFSPKSLFKKRVIIPLLILVLLGGLGWGILQEQKRRSTQEQEKTLVNVMEPAQKKYQEGMDLLSLNEELAIEDIAEAERMLLSAKDTFPEGSEAKTEYDALLSKVQTTLKQYRGESSVAGTTTIFNAQGNDQLSSVSSITRKGGALYAVGNDGTVAELDSGGSIKKTYSTDASRPIALTATDTFIYILDSGGIYQADKNGSSGKQVVEAAGLSAIDAFGSNVYGLNSADKELNKYSGSEFSESSYFASSPDFQTPPVSFSIDSAIWVLEQNGTIHKFLRGAEESFSVKNLPKIGSNSLIYTEEGMNNLYVLDRTGKKVLIIDKDGSYKSSHGWDGITTSSTFAVDESGKKVYISANNQIVSFDLQ